MELANIEQLIERYDNAETSLTEEQQLKEYFQQENIPAHLLGYKLAYAETQKAFQLISQNLNKGGSVAMAGLQEFGKAQNKVFKTTKK